VLIGVESGVPQYGQNDESEGMSLPHFVQFFVDTIPPFHSYTDKIKIFRKRLIQ